MESCNLCPRNCKVNREADQIGFCGQTARLKVARASLHMWEEPCISGATGSGTVFFSGCNLKCIFCQNHSIALGQQGHIITVSQLAQVFLALQKKGAANINLVTPTHYIPQIVSALRQAKDMGLTIPIVYNSSGYEEVSALRLLDGLVDIYLPDLKYYSSDLSKRYSNAPDYFEKACDALSEMFRQVGPCQFQDPVDPENTLGTQDVCDAESVPLLKKGMIVRHLLLPGQTGDSKKVLHYLFDTYKHDIYVSIMNQYTPLPQVAHIPELDRRVSEEEYGRVIDYCLRLGMDNAFIQEGETASESFIPDFNAGEILNDILFAN